MEITFVLLGLSICTVWVQPIAALRKVHIPAWTIFFILAVISGLIAGYLTYEAIFILSGYIASAYLAKHFATSKWQCYFFEALVIVFTAGLVLHQFPGFHNPALTSGIFLSNDAPPFTLYAKFDKATAGLVMLAFFCQRSRSLAEIKSVLAKTWPIALGTIFGLIALAAALGHIKLDLKIPEITLLFLITKLLFTCVCEEAIFRGFIQERLKKLFAQIPLNGMLTVFCSGLLFGLGHAGGGLLYVSIATVAGICYAYAYFHTRRIEAPILTHFTLITVHFFCFTYPYIR